MICSKCGKENKDTAKFCAACGAKLKSSPGKKNHPRKPGRLLIAVVIAVIIVLAMNLVGSLLISALIIFPALSAMRLFKSFRAVTICSAVVSVTGTAAGILISILAGTPVGSTIVAVDLGVFALFALLGALTGRTD